MKSWIPKKVLIRIRSEWKCLLGSCPVFKAGSTEGLLETLTLRLPFLTFIFFSNPFKILPMHTFFLKTKIQFPKDFSISKKNAEMQMGTSEISKGQHKTSRQDSKPAGHSYNHLHFHSFYLLGWFYRRYGVTYESLVYYIVSSWQAAWCCQNGTPEGQALMGMREIYVSREIT